MPWFGAITLPMFLTEAILATVATGPISQVALGLGETLSGWSTCCKVHSYHSPIGAQERARFGFVSVRMSIPFAWC